MKNPDLTEKKWNNIKKKLKNFFLSLYEKVPFTNRKSHVEAEDKNLSEGRYRVNGLGKDTEIK